MRFTAICVVITDMPGAIDFYARLGLKFNADSPEHAEAELAPGVQLMLDTQESLPPFTPLGWVKPKGSPRAALAFEVSDVDAIFAELIAAGGKAVREPFDAFWGHRYASVADKDGNGIDLFCPIATS